jgi:hypothetical protein
LWELVLKLKTVIPSHCSVKIISPKAKKLDKNTEEYMVYTFSMKKIFWYHSVKNMWEGFQVSTKISVVASIIDCNVSLRGNNHNYCNIIKNHCRVLLQRNYFLTLLTKVTLLLLKDIATNMTLLNHISPWQ